MKNTKNKIMLPILLALSFLGFAQQVSEDEAIRVALSELRFAKGDVYNVVAVYPYLDENGNTLLYEVVTDAGYSVLVTGNRICVPVVGRYQSIESGSVFDNMDSLPCVMKIFIEDYLYQVSYSFQHPELEAKHDEDWNEMLNDNAESFYLKSSLGAVEPLLTTRWGQSASNTGIDRKAYNYYIEACNSQKNKLAGCIAVAMGQVMRYWEYPMLIPEKRQFDWCNMSDELNENSPNYQKEKEAIAWLLKRCGDLADINYGCNNSTSTVSKAKDALREFGYSSDATHKMWPGHPKSKTNRIRQNLNNGWPVIYGAGSILSDGTFLPSHALVCDGYSSDGKFHFNWGWRSKHEDDYFWIDSLYSNSTSYNIYASAIFELYPYEMTPSYCDMDLSMSLDMFYHYYYLINNNSSNIPTSVTPKTLKTLTSAREESDVSYRTIFANDSAEYVARKAVRLMPGFHAERGCEFHAYIDPCNNCGIVNDEGESVQGVSKSFRMVKLPQSENDLFETSALTLYPNPVCDRLTVSLNDFSTKDVRVYNMQGQPMRLWNIESYVLNELILNVESLPKGVYLLQLISDQNQIVMGRFVKQ